MTKQMLDKDGKVITDEIVPDGGSLRISATLMDAARLHALAAILTDSQKGAFADALNAGGTVEDAVMEVLTSRPASASAANRPGYAALTDGERAAREKAVMDRSARLSERWREPAAADATPAAKTSPTSSQMTPADRRDDRLRDAWRQGAN